MDVLYVHPKGEGHGWSESHFGRIAEMDVLYVHPKGEGHGWPESLPLFRGRGVHVHHERKVRFRVKNHIFFIHD